MIRNGVDEMKNIEYKDMIFHSYTDNTDAELLELMYNLTKEGAEVRLNFADSEGIIDFSSLGILVFKGELTISEKGHSKIFRTKRAGQSEIYAIDSVVQVFKKNGAKYELVYSSPKLKEHKFLIETSEDKGIAQGSLYLLLNNEKRFVKSAIGKDAVKQLENARDFYLGKRHKIK